MIMAVLLGPIIAVQVSKFIDRTNEARSRRLKIFKTLMATRGTTLAPAHIEALNMIDLEFDSSYKKDKAVKTAWKIYLDHLNDRHYPQDSWGAKRVELLVDLLHTMALSLNYDFDKSHIRNTTYLPEGVGDVENDQLLIRKSIVALLQGHISLPIHARPLPSEKE